MYPFKIVKYNPKKSAPECPFQCGGGVQKLNGQCPNAPSMNLRKASLTQAVMMMVKIMMIARVDIIKDDGGTL